MAQQDASSTAIGIQGTLMSSCPKYTSMLPLKPNQAALNADVPLWDPDLRPLCFSEKLDRDFQKSRKCTPAFKAVLFGLIS